ncbi:dihydroorotate dehydrogenase-like protein [Williamwhitmania taraxaci]|uniref:Dihydroorotate dehydrogenase (Fumarate) n=1 Tax=Williamwhitmania taraxaci TaxID=1640674 RepID=A0A1G6HU13_9BACT|nr:dihydroorotate dehydrogenase-like protein [Williamwhitmania taraxaci]SDB97325.1 dihydroorotate dehydrogenase (fumarate) [Williamwhitmania taraxaci]
MPEISTNYMGLKLKSPIIASSSGLTDTIEKLIDLEKSGVGAVVLKSIFEEEIIQHTQRSIEKMSASGFIYPETMEYFEYDYDEIEDPVQNYLKLISDAKKKLTIPVIASINCVSENGWDDFAHVIEKAGADALELNIFLLPSDSTRSADDNEKIYFEAIKRVLAKVKIPVSIKLGPYASNLAALLEKLSKTGIAGLVLFNRSYNTDFDINTLEFTNSSVLTTPADIYHSLRWVALMSGKVKCSLAASTGVHDGAGLIKMLLAGASTVQVASTLYRNGNGQVAKMISELTHWMNEQGYKNLSEFSGKMSYTKTYNPAAFERIQFMQQYRNYGK